MGPKGPWEGNSGAGELEAEKELVEEENREERDFMTRHGWS